MVSDTPSITSDNSVSQDMSVGWVKKQLKQVNSNKSTNSNDYPSWLSKDAAEDLCIPVAHIINCMLQTEQYPNRWKNYELRPIPKSSSTASYSDFRPIALSYHVAKIAESAIISKIKPHVSISNNQFAYQPKLNTTKALINMLHDWTSDLDNKTVSHVEALFIDMSKAFDRLNPGVLLRKLLNTDLSHNMITLINSYLTERKLTVRVGNTTSGTCQTSVGTPQGSRLGPLLWIFYINDMTPSARIIKYADDCTIYTPVLKNSCSNLLTSATYIEKWCKENSMLLNAKKSVVMPLRPRNLQEQVQPIRLEDTLLQIVNNFKILGVIVDERLTFEQHISYVLGKVNSRIYILRKLYCHHVDESARIRFYRACILPVLLYGVEAWYGFLSKNNCERLERAQNLALKLVCGPHLSSSERLTRAGCLSINDLYHQRRQQLFSSISGENNTSLNDILRMHDNKNRRSDARHRGSDFSFKIRTELYKKSFFMQSFLNHK